MENRRAFLSSLLGLAAAGLSPGPRAAGEPVPGQPAAATGYLFDPRCLDYEVARLNPEVPARLAAVQRMMRRTELDKEVIALLPLADVMPAIRRIHTEQHVRSIAALGPPGAAALRAAGAALAGVKAVCEGTVRNAFCAIRPPGHHARDTGREEGFCYFNNIAVAARYAQDAFALGRVLIIDWDYHHGNGTEEAFYTDPTVLYFSTHNRHAYPGTGDPARQGAGPGLGYTINVHLPCRSTEYDMYTAWETKLLPKVASFKPEIVLISAGFDGRKGDPLGCFDVTDAGFVKLTQMAMAIAKTHCHDRLVSLLEGGYDPEGLAMAAHAHLCALMGKV